MAGAKIHIVRNDPAAESGWRDTVGLWWRRSMTRMVLRELDLKQLNDLGMTGAERAAECRKWFWES